MQLPRGTFCEIKKAELISSLLDELERSRFTGICSISSVPVRGTLVFRHGTCILAKTRDKSGEGAWNELQMMRDHPTDAALSSLDEVQVRLALEFNKPCRIIKNGKSTPAEAHRQQKHVAASPRRPAGKTAAPPQAAPLQPAAEPPEHPHPDQKPAATAHLLPRTGVHEPPEPKAPEKTEDISEDLSSFERDIDTFNALDIETVTEKLRKDCKTLIEQLELDHLTER